MSPPPTIHVERIRSPTKALVQIADDLRLVRYVPFARFLTLLAGELTFTPLRFLGKENDPLESRAISEPEVIEFGLNRLKNSNAVLEEIKAAAPDSMRRIWNDSTQQSQRSTVIAQAFHRFIGETRAASCWFSSKFESAAMWAAFARQGVAVETRLADLESVLPRDRKFLVAAVRYRDRGKFLIDEENAADNPHMVLRPYLLKGREFMHEREVRIVTRCHRIQEWFSVPTPNFAKCIHRVVISPYLDPVSALRMKNHIERLFEPMFDNDEVPLVDYSTIIEPFIKEKESEAGIDRLYDEYMPPDDKLPL